MAERKAQEKAIDAAAVLRAIEKQAARLFGDDDGPEMEAQEHAWAGFSALDEGDFGRARRCFDEASRIVPDLPDAENGRGEMALAEGEAARAAECFRRAIEAAQCRLGDDRPAAFAWWGEIETRPYMRAREGLARALWSAGDLKAAVAEYREILRRNPGDNQGARYLVAPLLLHGGDLPAALAAFRDFDRDYPGDRDEPHYELSRALALFLAGDGDGALAALTRALFANPYIVPWLLGHNPKRERIWHGTNLAELAYAEDYRVFSPAWEEASEAWNALSRFWTHPAVKERLGPWFEVGRKLERRSRREKGGDKEWRKLLAERDAIAGEPLPPEVAADALARPIEGDARDALRRRIAEERRRIVVRIRDLDRRDVAPERLNAKAMRAFAEGDGFLTEFEKYLAEDPSEPEPETKANIDALAELVAAAQASLEDPEPPKLRIVRGGAARKRRAW